MYDAIVLAGGRARRLGGAAKPQLTVGGRTLLDTAVTAVASAARIVVVGPEQPVARPVRWCREEPPGGGPVAALAAGLPAIAPAVPHLLAAVPGEGAAVLTDAEGRANYLAAAWRRSSLAAALSALGSADGVPMRALYAAAPIVAVPDTGGWGQDCDTWDELARARAGRGGGTDA